MGLSDALEKSKQKLVNEAGRAVVKKAVDDLTLSPEEKAQRAAKDETASRLRLVKLILGGVAVLVTGIVLMRLMARLWMLGIGVVIVGGVGAAAYLVMKPKLEALKQRRLAARAEEEAARTAGDRARAEEDAKTAAQKKLEDDLARLKQQV